MTNVTNICGMLTKRIQKWNMSWKLRNHLRKNDLIPMSLFPSDQWEVRDKTYQLLKLMGWPLHAQSGDPWRSPSFTTRPPTSFLSHRHLPRTAMFRSQSIACSFPFPFLCLKCPCSPQSPGVLPLRFQGSVQTWLPLRRLQDCQGWVPSQLCRVVGTTAGKDRPGTGLVLASYRCVVM